VSDFAHIEKLSIFNPRDHQRNDGDVSFMLSDAMPRRRAAMDLWVAILRAIRTQAMARFSRRECFKLRSNRCIEASGAAQCRANDLAQAKQHPLLKQHGYKVNVNIG